MYYVYFDVHVVYDKISQFVMCKPKPKEIIIEVTVP